VLIQNGVGVEQPYRTRFPTTPIISAVTVISAEQTSPGTVRQHRWTRIHLGPYTNSASFSTPGSETTTTTGPRGDDTTGALTPTGAHQPTPSTDPPTTTLDTTGTHLATLLSDWWTRLGQIRDVDLSTELGLQTIRWHKLCINAAFNPSSILSGGRGNADMVLSDPELRTHLAGVMREIWDAAPRILGGGRGFGPDMATPERILKSTERNVGSKPSMLLDWEAGRPLEVEVILGNPIRIARARGVELPRLQTVYALVRSMQAVRDAARREGRGKL
jgi:2-dehydropantoate 2-reductase